MYDTRDEWNASVVFLGKIRLIPAHVIKHRKSPSTRLLVLLL